MKTIFKQKKATVRLNHNGTWNMITFSVPFKDLPVKTYFRYGYQQDDFDYVKINDSEARESAGHGLVITKVNKNKVVLIDFMVAL